MTEQNAKEIGLLSEKARLFDEFPPNSGAVTAKLEALALQVEVMYGALKQADAQVGSCSLSRIDAAIEALESAGDHYNERLREFSTVYALIRDHVSSVTLLPSWRDYAKRYHEQIEARHSPRGED